MPLPSSGEYQDFLNRTADALYRAYGPADATGPELLKFLRGAALGYTVDVVGPGVIQDLGATFTRLMAERGTPVT